MYDKIKIAENSGFLVSELVKLRVDEGLTQRDLVELTRLKILTDCHLFLTNHRT